MHFNFLISDAQRPVSMRLWAAVLLAAAAALWSPPSHAGLKEAVQSMYLSSTTNARAIQTMKMNGFFAGQIMLRGPGKSFTVVQFAPPKINAGCGGIDIFFGAFSFINGKQFEQMIRSIIAAVPSMVLRMAIAQMCEECGKIIDKLQEFANSVNQLGRMTCQMAGYLFDKNSRTAIDGAFKNVQSSLLSLTGAVSDALAGRSAAETKSTGETAAAVESNGAAKGADIPAGDLVCKGLRQNAGVIKTMDGYFSASEIREIVQSLLGTVVYPSKKTEDAQTCPAGTPKAGCGSGGVKYVAPTIAKVEDLFRDRDPTLEPLRLIYNPSYSDTPSEDSCADEPLEKSDTTWKGLRHRIRTALFGSDDPYSSGSLSNASLVYEILYGSGIMSEMSEEDKKIREEGKKILQTFGGNLPTLIREANLAAGEGFAVVVADHYITHFVIPAIEYHVATQINRAIGLAFSDRKYEGNISNPEKAEPIHARRLELSRELDQIVSRFRSTSALDANNRAIWAIQLHQQLKAPQGTLKK